VGGVVVSERGETRAPRRESSVDREYADDGHRLRFSFVPGQGLQAEIICPHPDRDVPEAARCAWYRPAGSGPYWCGLQLELREEGTGALVWDWVGAHDAPIVIAGDISFEWKVTHYEDDAPEVVWRPLGVDSP
jgi:hypothetical protein